MSTTAPLTHRDRLVYAATRLSADVRTADPACPVGPALDTLALSATDGTPGELHAEARAVLDTLGACPGAEGCPARAGARELMVRVVATVAQEA